MLQFLNFKIKFCLKNYVMLTRVVMETESLTEKSFKHDLLKLKIFFLLNFNAKLSLIKVL